MAKILIVDDNYLAKDLECSDGLKICYASRQIFINGQEIKVRKKEFDIISLLSKYPGRIFTRDQIFSLLWDSLSDTNPSIITCYVCSIRTLLKKCGASSHLQTIWGVGYKWED